ncbi:MAG: replicative DNA helicase [Humidesulfovibrio sp.]|uniref:replicative DNA helicase n=1 Tax=Humidesulfovibrio sp. TaxID=2910988 RepID=UPI002732FB19|nr:replicative DNA helicase [Humidesulfovibrio sp.]MDP2848864.1 replicative DNA helicase [Humidesulfovibrio sp.]
MASRKKNPNSSPRRSPGDARDDGAEALERASAALSRNVPPQNLEAEQAVLGGVFLRNTLFHSLVDVIRSDDFYSPAHRLIFRSFEDLYSRNAPIDLITVTEYLSQGQTLDSIGGPVYLAELASSPVSAANALYHASIVRDKAVARRLIEAASEIIGNCYDSQDVEGLLDQSEQSIFKISDVRSKTTVHTGKELVDRVFKELEKRVGRQAMVTGITTGYEKLDEMTAGMQNSDLIIVAARPSMGKTAFALNLALNAATKGETQVPTAIFSLEMSMDQIMMRLLCCQGRVDQTNLRRGSIDDQDWAKLYEAANIISTAPIFVDDTAALSTMELRARCRRLKSEHNLGLVVVDYLQLMRASRDIDSREQEISDISRNLKALAKELNIPVIALSQLNRKVEERSDKRPMLSDLRESGAIEQDADVIMFIYRDDVYNKKEGNPKAGVAEIIIGKQRNGPVGEVELFFKKQYSRFENLNQIAYPSEYFTSS